MMSDRTVPGGILTQASGATSPTHPGMFDAQDNSFSFNNVRNTRIFNSNQSNKLIFYSKADCLTQTKKLELEIFIQENSPDIIGITEVFSKHALFLNQVFYHLENYMLLNTLTNGRGVTIFIKRHLNAEETILEMDLQGSIQCKLKFRTMIHYQMNVYTGALAPLKKTFSSLKMFLNAHQKEENPTSW